MVEARRQVFHSEGSFMLCRTRSDTRSECPQLYKLPQAAQQHQLYSRQFEQASESLHKTCALPCVCTVRIVTVDGRKPARHANLTSGRLALSSFTIEAYSVNALLHVQVASS